MSNKKQKKKKAPRQKKKPLSQAEAMALQQQMARADQHLQQDELDEAEKIYVEIIKRYPTYAPAIHMYGLFYHFSGNDPMAEELINKAIQYQYPPSAQFYYHLGMVREDLLEYAGAVTAYRKAIQLSPKMAELHLALGNALTEDGQLSEAAESFQKAIDLKPTLAEAHFGLGNVLFKDGQEEGAAAEFTEALRLQPDLAGHFMQHATNHQKKQRPNRAISFTKKVIQLTPDSAEAYNLMGGLEALRGHSEGAARCYKKALEMTPDDLSALTSLGSTLMGQGKLNEAEELLERARSINPDNTSIYAALATCKKFSSQDDPLVQTCEDLLLTKDVSDMDTAPLHFALGKIYNDSGEFTKAFDHYRQGNHIRYQKNLFDPQAHADRVNKTIEAFPENYASRAKGLGSESETPVFIVGMPRSGTTLTEQIIAAHPLCYGAGELTEAEKLVKRLTVHFGPMKSFKECIRKIEPKFIRTLAETYLAQLPHHDDPAIKRITDKMPFNFFNVGWITLLFPNAKIIHTRRHPMDTALSIYFQNFLAEMTFAFDLKAIGEYYREYDRLMAHWRRVIPKNFIELNYEDLVTDFEPTAGKLIDFVGLEWDDACLEFHRKKRDVKTASLWQVRQPIYKSSLQRWRNYEAHIGPLREALGDLVSDNSPEGPEN